MDRSHHLEMAIYRHLYRMSECSFEDLLGSLPQYTWNEMFGTVDRLSREGRLTLRHPRRFGFVISTTEHTFEPGQALWAEEERTQVIQPRNAA
ncbi:hypothetical protein [Nitrospira sp. Nam80]